MQLQNLKNLHTKATQITDVDLEAGLESNQIAFVKALVNAFPQIVKRLEAGKELAEAVRRASSHKCRPAGGLSNMRYLESGGIEKALARYQSQVKEEVCPAKPATNP